MKRSLLVFVALAALAGGCSEPEAKKQDGKDKDAVAGGKNPVVVIKTSEGTIKAELFADKAPGTVRNFLAYVDDKHYDGTIFHRVIGTPVSEKDFMIQGGGFTKGFGNAKTPADLEKYRKKTRDPIKNESGNGLLNERGTLAMARTGEPNSATDQFFINLKHNEFLDKEEALDSVGYAVFGKVTEGMDVVDKIKQVKTKKIPSLRMADVPVDEVVIESIRREE